MPNLSTQEAIERLLMLTLSIEQASDNGDARLVRQLLDERSSLIDLLEQRDLAAYRDRLSEALEVDARLILKLGAERQMLTGRLTRHVAARKAGELYKRPPSDDGPQVLERVS